MGKAIQDNNWLYNVLSPLVQFGTRCHYHHFVVRGMENLPKDGAYIFAPCHQQALMEPLAVLNIAPKPPVFLARADIFEKPAVRAILTFLKIMPVYRIRDGKENLSKNGDIFDRSRDVLLDGYPLCLMAEGRHNDRHHLLPLVKGMFRIAGETQRKLGDHPLYILPTGIDFDEYERPYSNLVVNIGKPIPVQPFMETFENNEPVALNQMREALTKALRPLMHDIRSDEHYEEILTLCNIMNPFFRKGRHLRSNAWNRFCMRQQIAQTLDAREGASYSGFDTLVEKTRRYKALCRSLHIGEKCSAEHGSFVSTLLMFLVFAAFIASIVIVPQVRWIVLFMLLCFPVPFLPTYLIPKKIIKDSQFRSSINFGIRFLFSILYCIVISIVVACCGGMWMSRLADIGAWWGLVAVALVHIEAVMAGPTVNALKWLGSNCHYWILCIFRPKKMKELVALQKSLEDGMTYPE